MIFSSSDVSLSNSTDVIATPPPCKRNTVADAHKQAPTPTITTMASRTSTLHQQSIDATVGTIKYSTAAPVVINTTITTTGNPARPTPPPSPTIFGHHYPSYTPDTHTPLIQHSLLLSPIQNHNMNETQFECHPHFECEKHTHTTHTRRQPYISMLNDTYVTIFN